MRDYFRTGGTGQKRIVDFFREMDADGTDPPTLPSPPLPPPPLLP